MDDAISTFCAFTSGTADQAQRYLTLTDGNVEQAVELFYSSPDLGAAAQPPPTTTRPAQQQSSREAPILIDDDEDDEDDDTPREDDEAMARRLQEEMYGTGADADGIRAPMARTTETLVGPGSSDWRDDPNEMNAAIAQQLMDRRRRRAGPGIFNQRETPSIWANDDPNDPVTHREVLSRATGGASDQTSKSNLLADLFRPPFDLLSNLRLPEARDEGKEKEKWILINVQDPSIFDCQVLNRDIWKNASIRDTIKEHFIFLQYNKDDPRVEEYVNYYMGAMRDSEDAYPHIAIIDPRTGERVKSWSGSPAPKASDFLMDLHEFLDRYSLKMEKKNPVQTKKREGRKDVSAMSEEEMLEMALHASMANGNATGAPPVDDPDAYTKPSDKGKGPAEVPVTYNRATPPPPPAAAAPTASAETPAAVVRDTPFSRISAANPHDEPTSTDPKETTRIQFRHSAGRVVRRFALADPVRRIYEWLKAAPLEGKDGAPFELISMGRNLMDLLDLPISEAGLRNGTVMVEFVED